MNVDLGCGKTKQPGFIGVDKDPHSAADVIHDISTGLPFCDNSVDLITASHILEHLNDTMFIMKEIWRVCKHGSQVAIAVPHYQSIGAWQDPTHVRAFTEVTFHYFDPDHPLYKVYEHGITFKIRNIVWNIAGNIEAVLECIKEPYGKKEESKEKILKREVRGYKPKNSRRTKMRNHKKRV